MATELLATPPRMPSLAGARVCLIVDHPLRDLPGITLIANELARAGAVCYLTPFNVADVEIWRLVPDFVLFNYFRRNLTGLYEEIRRAEIPFGVLDTEGGVLESVQTYGSEMAQPPRLRRALRCLCSWGPRLAQYLVEEQGLTERQVKVTGCPRTDFYVGPLRQAACELTPEAADYDRQLILVNSNFSIGNPALMSDQEQQDLMVQLGHDPHQVQRWQQAERSGMQALMEVAERLARDFPQATVVYRPHPFENMAVYESRFAGNPRLHCLRQGSIGGWLLRAKAVIQKSCSTSIESGMAGVPSLTPAWVPTSFTRPAADATSHACENWDELAHAVECCLEDRFQASAQVRSQLDEVIRDWFYRVDGQCHFRVAQAIADQVRHAPSRRHLQQACRKRVYGLHRSLTSRRYWAGVARYLGGYAPDYSFRHKQAVPVEGARYQKLRNSVKYFQLHDVQQVVRALNRAQDAGHHALPTRLVAEAAQPREDYLFPVGGASVRLAHTAG